MKGTTVYFNIDVRTMQGNPHQMPTPFGLAQTIGRGNVFERHDRLEAALRDACERLEAAGFPAADLEAVLTPLPSQEG